MRRCVATLILTALLAASITDGMIHCAEAGLLGAPQQRRQPMVGAYFPAETKDPFIVAAAEYAVQRLMMMKGGGNDGQIDGSDTSNTYSFLPELQQGSSSYTGLHTTQTKIQVVHAEMQVVAGRNYKLSIILSRGGSLGDGGICVGGFQVLIYDHFGEFSVTKWGEELTCEEIESGAVDYKDRAKTLSMTEADFDAENEEADLDGIEEEDDGEGNEDEDVKEFEEEMEEAKEDIGAASGPGDRLIRRKE